MQRLVDVGLSLKRGEDQVELEEVVELVKTFLQNQYGEFSWRFAIRSTDLENPGVIPLLDHALSSLERNQSDFELVCTQERLWNPQGRSVSAAASSLLNVAAVSTSVPAGFEGARRDFLARRILLALCALNGIASDEWVLGSPFETGTLLSDPGRHELRVQLESVSDERLEEKEPQGGSGLMFAVRALWTARRELGQTILRGRPWLFPFRIPKLMAGAGSAGLVVMLTAEAWELGASQSWLRVCVLAGLVWGLTVAFLLARDGVIARRLARRSEQRVVARTAMAVGVALGMLLAFFTAAIVSLGIGWGFYPSDLVSSWTGLPWSEASLARVATFVATVGLGVGAMGVSLDAPSFFKYAVVVTSEFKGDHAD